MRCPACSHEMIEKEYEGETLHHCEGCGGYFLTEEELRAVEEKRDKEITFNRVPLPSARYETTRYCPVCSAEMRKEEAGVYFPKIVDRCPQGHGYFLDIGELEYLQDDFERYTDNVKNKS